MTLRASLLLLVFGLQAFSLVAITGPAAAQGDPTVEMARQRFREGVGFYDQREYEKARLAFLQAYALKPHPSVLLNLAQSELRANRAADAANHFAQYLRENPDSSDAELQEAELGFAAARSQVGELRLDVDTEGADITVDGAQRGRSPLAGPVYLDAGAHQVEARAGEKRATTTVEVATGKVSTARLKLSAGAAASPAAHPPAEGGGESPAASEEPTEGSADFSATADSGGGRKSFFTWFADTPVAWIGAGVAVAGLGAGTFFAFSAKSEYDDANALAGDIESEFAVDSSRLMLPGNERPCTLGTSSKSKLGADRSDQYATACTQYGEIVDRAEQNELGAMIGFIVGGAAAVGTVVYYFVDPSAQESAAHQGAPWYAGLRPITSPSVQGVMLQGSF